MIRSLRGTMTMPWLVLGDFNEILYNHEKDGGRPRTQRQLQAFHDALSACQLSDLGLKGINSLGKGVKFVKGWIEEW